MDIRQFILPAGVGLTHIQVYTEPEPTGVIGGGAHIHTVCSEIYYVLAGTGTIELLTAGGLETVELVPQKVVFFRPGVIHRVLNPNQNLQILAIMQNGGLPDRGDFVLTFPHDILTSPTAYAQAVRVPTREDAIRRRDLSIEGYNALKAAFQEGPAKGREAMRQFYRAASKLMAPKVDAFEWVLKSGAQSEVKDSLDAVDFLRVGRIDYMERARHATVMPAKNIANSGLCGELHPYALDETFFAEGTKVA